MADARRHKLVMISDGLLASMANDERFRKEFPFIGSLKSAPARRTTGCGGCGGSNQQRAGIFQAAKRAIAGMSSESKQKLKRMLDTRQARVVYTKDDGRGVELTF